MAATTPPSALGHATGVAHRPFEHVWYDVAPLAVQRSSPAWHSTMHAPGARPPTGTPTAAQLPVAHAVPVAAIFPSGPQRLSPVASQVPIAPVAQRGSPQRTAEEFVGFCWQISAAAAGFALHAVSAAHLPSGPQTWVESASGLQRLCPGVQSLVQAAWVFAAPHDRADGLHVRPAAQPMPTHL